MFPEANLPIKTIIRPCWALNALPSVLADLQQAVGQYVLYRTWMHTIEPERILYLAVDEETAANIFAAAFARIVADDLQIRLIVVNIDAERIVEWKHFPTTDRS